MPLIRFFDFCFDPDAERLTRGENEIWLRPRTLKLLSYLFGQPDRVIAKEELMAALWPDRIVTDDSLTQCVKDLRKALGTDAETLVRTVHGRGYVLESKLFDVCASPKDETTTDVLRSNMRSTVAIGSTRDLSQEGALTWLASGLTEDFVSALSRIPQLTVIHPAPNFETDQELRTWSTSAGVDFVLRTSLQASGKRIRLSVQIVDARTMQQIWSETFDSLLEHVFEAQDEIVRKVAVATQTELTFGALAQLWEGGTRSLAAWTEMCAGRTEFLKFNAISMRAARTRLAKAVELDPSYTGAMIQLGLCYYWDARFNTDLDRGECLRAAESMANAAFEITTDLPTAHMLRGGILFLRDKHDDALTACRTAVGLSPSDSWAIAYCGLVHVYAGQAKDALDLVARAKQLSPRSPGWYTYVEALATLAIGDLVKAEALAIINLEQEPDDTASFVNLALALAMRGKKEQASGIIHTLRLQFPRYSMAGFMRSERYRDAAYRDRLAGLLLELGMPPRSDL